MNSSQLYYWMIYPRTFMLAHIQTHSQNNAVEFSEKVMAHGVRKKKSILLFLFMSQVIISDVSHLILTLSFL